MLIRRFKHEDAESCTDIINASVTTMRDIDEQTRFQLIAKNIPADLCAILKQGYSLIVEEHGNIIAVGSLSKDGEIHHVHVIPDMARLNIEKSVLHALEDTARKHGHTEVRLQVIGSYVELYENLGYVVVGTENQTIGTVSYETVKMTKSLAELAGV